MNHRFVLTPIDALGRSYPGKPVTVVCCPVCRALVAEGEDYDEHATALHTVKTRGKP